MKPSIYSRLNTPPSDQLQTSPNFDSPTSAMIKMEEMKSANMGSHNGVGNFSHLSALAIFERQLINEVMPPACANCRLPILDRTFSSLSDGRNFHDMCLQCSGCGQLPEKTCNQTASGSLLCKGCYST